MMLFIPLHDNIEASYCQKVIFNQNKYLGDETALAIQGLNNLCTIIKLKNDQTVSLWMLLIACLRPKECQPLNCFN